MKQLFDLAFQNQIKKNYEISKKLYKKILSIDSNILLANYNLAIVYEELNEIDNAIIHYEKTINLNPKFANAYNNLGLIYSEQGNFQKAIDYYILALEHEANQKNVIENLIYAITFHNPNLNHPLISANNDLKKLTSKVNFESILEKNKFNSIFKKAFDIKKKIKNIYNPGDYTYSQIYRRNSYNLNCQRHHKIFNKISIIPKFCFSCFKIQIEPKNVLELIKLSLIFDLIELPKNNWRKCFIEMRPSISGTYKGLIYCTGFNEADKILNYIDPILKMHLDYKISMKRGCSEFYSKFPNFKITKNNDINFMKYNNDWKKIETKEDLDNNFKKINFKETLSGLSLSDILIINQWITYANIIGDTSYKVINLRYSPSDYILKKMVDQKDMRKKQFLC